MIITTGAERDRNNGRRKERQIGVVVLSAEEGKGPQEKQESREGETQMLVSIHQSIHLALYFRWRFSYRVTGLVGKNLPFT